MVSIGKYIQVWLPHLAAQKLLANQPSQGLGSEYMTMFIIMDGLKGQLVSFDTTYHPSKTNRQELGSAKYKP